MKKTREELNVKAINESVSILKKILKILFVLIIGCLILLAIFLLRETKIISIILGILKVLSPFFIGILLAWLFDPFVNFLSKKGINRILAAVFAYFILIIFIAVFFTFLVPVLYKQINEFIGTLPGMVVTIKDFISNIFDNFSNSGIDLSSTQESIFSSIEANVTNLTTSLPTTLVSIISSLISGVGTFAIGLVIGFYLLIDFNNVKHSLDFLPKKVFNPTISVLRKLNETCRDFVQGTLVISCLITLISLLGFWIIGLDSPVLFAIIVGITNIIPYVGPWIGGAISAVVGFSISPLVGVLTILVVFIAQQIESIALQPLIMAKTMKLHPVTVICGLLIFGYFGGIVGMIFATPIISCVKILINFLDKKFEIKEKVKESLKIFK